MVCPFGFIGPNGAGKPTTIRLLMGLIRPDRGHATLVGLDAQRDSIAVKRRVGYLPGELPRFPGMTAGQVVGLLAGLRGGVDPERITSLARRQPVGARIRSTAPSAAPTACPRVVASALRQMP
jgi:ABC-2 type transport system ATP-binding protein